MRISVLLLLAAFSVVTGCSSVPPEVKSMPVFSSPPDQPYKRVSDVFASGDDMDEAIWDAKKKAYAVGGNAILIKETKGGSFKVKRGFGGGSVSRDVSLTVEAIRLEK